MSLVRYYAAQTLDGYIAEADDSIDWLTGYEGSFEGADSDEGQAGYDAFYEGIGALVMGSVTYEWVLAHGRAWPYAGKPTWVLSSRELERPEGRGRRRPHRRRRAAGPDRRDAERRRRA